MNYLLAFIYSWLYLAPVTASNLKDQDRGNNINLLETNILWRHGHGRASPKNNSSTSAPTGRKGKSSKKNSINWGRGGWGAGGYGAAGAYSHPYSSTSEEIPPAPPAPPAPPPPLPAASPQPTPPPPNPAAPPPPTAFGKGFLQGPIEENESENENDKVKKDKEEDDENA